MFFSIYARNLTRHQILVVGILLEKGAGRRHVVLRTSKLVNWSGLPTQTLDKAIARLDYLGIVSRKTSGRNFAYRVSLASVRLLKRPTFPDRISLSAELGIKGFGMVPRQMSFFGREQPLPLKDATLDDLLQMREELARRQQRRARKSGSVDQLDRLIEIHRKYGGVTLIEALQRYARMEGSLSSAAATSS